MRELTILLAKYTVVIPYLVLAYVWWRASRKNKKQIIIFSVCMIVLSAVFGLIAQHLYVNPRPPFKDGSVPYFKPSDYNGFPSDHTLFASAAAFCVLKFRRTWGYWLLSLSVFIGWMRVVVHVHHAIDIIGGLVLTGLAYYVCLKLFPLLSAALKSDQHHQA